MARDDFTRATIERMAKRVGMRCSNPDCRVPTSGPDGDGGVTNTGVAAHIHAASPGWARYDPDMTSEERSGFNNGIWLCQNHAKLIDDDETTYTPAKLREWKDIAEKLAAVEALGYSVKKSQPFVEMERKAPDLVAEMRDDLMRESHVREFIIKSDRTSFGYGPMPLFRYTYEAHPHVLAFLVILAHYGAVYDVTKNEVPRFRFTEDFVAYLLGER